MWQLLGLYLAFAVLSLTGALSPGPLTTMAITEGARVGRWAGIRLALGHGLIEIPLVFAIATGIPVIIFAWLIAYAVSGIGKFYNNLKTFETWFRRIIAILFIGVGVYYLLRWLLQV